MGAFTCNMTHFTTVEAEHSRLRDGSGIQCAALRSVSLTTTGVALEAIWSDFLVEVDAAASSATTASATGIWSTGTTGVWRTGGI